MLYIGVPFGLQSVMYSFANVAITATVNAIGPEATKGMSIANQFDGLMYQIVMAPSYAIAAYVSQNIAAKNVKRAKQSVNNAILITFVMGASLGGLMAVCSPYLSTLLYARHSRSFRFGAPRYGKTYFPNNNHFRFYVRNSFPLGLVRISVITKFNFPLLNLANRLGIIYSNIINSLPYRGKTSNETGQQTYRTRKTKRRSNSCIKY